MQLILTDFFFPSFSCVSFTYRSTLPLPCLVCLAMPPSLLYNGDYRSMVIVESPIGMTLIKPLAIGVRTVQVQRIQ